MNDLEKCIDHTLRQYNTNKKIKKRKKDIEKILACKTIKELLSIRKKLNLLDWHDV